MVWIIFGIWDFISTNLFRRILIDFRRASRDKIRREKETGRAS